MPEPSNMAPDFLSDGLAEEANRLARVVQRIAVAEQSVFALETARARLTIPQYVTLSAIESFGSDPETMGRIASMAHQCSATMTGIVDRLEKMELVQRLSNPNDRRSVLVKLTELGGSKLAEVHEARRQRLGAMLAVMDEDSREGLAQALETYIDALEAIAAEP